MNIVAKCVKGKEYILVEMIATRMSKAKWSKVKMLNPTMVKRQKN